MRITSNQFEGYAFFCIQISDDAGNDFRLLVLRWAIFLCGSSFITTRMPNKCVADKVGRNNRTTKVNRALRL